MASFQSRCPNCRQSVAYRFTPSEERELFRALKVGIVCPACQEPFTVQLGAGGEFTTMVIRPKTTEQVTEQTPNPAGGLPLSYPPVQIERLAGEASPQRGTFSSEPSGSEASFSQKTQEQWEIPPDLSDPAPPFRPLDPVLPPQPTAAPFSQASFRDTSPINLPQDAPPFELLGGGAGHSQRRRRSKQGSSAWGRFYEWFAQLPVWQQYTALAALFGLAIVILLFPTPNTAKNTNMRKPQKQQAVPSSGSATDEATHEANSETDEGLPQKDQR